MGGVMEETFVTYEAFGAVGDGKQDDSRAIQKAHAYANEHRLPVRGKEGAVYYMGGRTLTAEIQTDTDWSGATFILDDREAENVKKPVFLVTSRLQAYDLDISSFQKDQKQLGRTLPTDCFVTIEDVNHRKYIRFGLNVDNGTEQTDCFVVRKDGTIENPIIWDFPEVTSCVAHPVDEEPLTLTGGTFVTIANQAERVYNYYWRNIEIRRSNTQVVNLSHTNTEEGESGSPYRGFLRIADCAYVTVKDSYFTGHKIYETIGRAGLPVPMGSYDIDVYRSSDVAFYRCRQDGIMDRTRWGLIGTNFCKNLYLESCTFSRFDAHMGVTNAHLKNCRLGWQCLNAIGHGTFIVEDTEAYGRALVNLREDYGSTWDGDMVIRNCIWHPAEPAASVLWTSNGGHHDFGYVCRMPRKLTVENLKIMDGAFAEKEGYEGPTIFNNYDKEIHESDPGLDREYPYVTAKEVHLSGIITESGKEIRLKENPYSMPGLCNVYLGSAGINSIGRR